ncbi:hypothetical protein B0H14DRAFT_3519031 [Mycena olivaceomarginata]|nr:hypothetical protein B0H14DRAFT_3519031 [Mycena olivaceomarginata]
MAWTCLAPFYPNHTNYMMDQEHNGNARKSWFLVLRAGLFTKRTDTEHQADISGALPSLHLPHARGGGGLLGGKLSQESPPQHEGSEEDGSPPPFSTPARSASCSAPVKAVRTLVKRESRALVKRKVRASVKHETPVKDEVEEAKTPLFREDSELAIVAQTQNICQCALSFAVCTWTQRLPHPSLQWDEYGLDLLGVKLSASVGSSASRAVPPLRSLPQHPPSSRPAATHLHAGGSPSTGVQSRRHAEPPILFNKSTRTLYKDLATAVREMGKGESVQVLEVEDLEEFFSAPSHAAAA